MARIGSIKRAKGHAGAKARREGLPGPTGSASVHETWCAAVEL